MPAGYPWSVLAGSRFCARYRNPKEPTMAPSFPDAAEMPWHVDRSLAGKISAGTMNVVALGPKLAKKKVRPYMTMKPMWCPGVVQCSYGTASPSMNTVIIRNPVTWIANRPNTSISATVNQ
uniref:Uncharacterized protein n=1 Tax=Zea mays TaxID=4577 RepID=C4J661_MAIZE|nr:unknown [Zea mays]